MFRSILLVSFMGAAGLARAEPLSFAAALQIATRSSPDIAVQTTGVEAARSLYLTAARRRDAGKPYSAQASMAKLLATDTAMRVATDAVQVLGGAGYTADFPVERYMREVKVMQIFEGTNQIQRMVIGRHLTQP